MSRSLAKEVKHPVLLNLPVSLHKRLYDVKYLSREYGTTIMIRGIEREVTRLENKMRETKTAVQ